MQSGTPRFEDVTETTGVPLTREAASMMATRYGRAAELAIGRRTLELGCAAGQGLGLIASATNSVMAGDRSLQLLRMARAWYALRFPLVQLSVEALPFPPGSFDLVILFEASYYVPRIDAAFQEIARVLAADGLLLIANANPERPDFVRSPHSTHYHSADEFRAALTGLGFDVRVDVAFPVAERSGRLAALRGTAVTMLRRVLEALGLVPRTLRGRARLKRLLYGKPIEVPQELPPAFAPRAALEPVSPGPVTGHKVIYVTARAPSPLGLATLDARTPSTFSSPQQLPNP